MIKKLAVLTATVMMMSTGTSTETCELPTCSKGVSSYYGKKFEGRTTASGTIFNPEEMTAAHKTLKFGTVLRVTNLENGKSVVVTITDRGPFIKGRALDLSKGAFAKISNVDKGIIRVKMEIINQE